MVISNIHKRSATILVIDPLSWLRTGVVAELRSQGFTNVFSSQNFENGFSLLETEKNVDWILCGAKEIYAASLKSTDLLNAAVRNDDLGHTMISLWVGEETVGNVPDLFARGALSWGREPRNLIELRGLIRDWLNSIGAHHTLRNAHVQISAKYLREYYRDQKKYDDIIDLELSLLSKFPGDKRVIAGLADAIFTLAASRVAMDANDQSPNLAPQARKKLGVDNIIGLNTCVIVEQDAETMRKLSSVMHALGCLEILGFRTLDLAVDWMAANKTPDLMITEWKIGDYECHPVLQKLIQEGPRGKVDDKTPLFLIHSNGINPEGLALLKELGISSHLKKPSSTKDMVESVMGLVRSDRHPETTTDLWSKFRRCVAARDKGKAGVVLRAIKSSPCPYHIKIMADAEFDDLGGSHEAAKVKIMDLISVHGPDYENLAILGKILLKLGDFKAAARILQKVNDHIPMNLGRVTHMAEAAIGMADSSTAKLALDTLRRLGIDPAREEALVGALSAIEGVQSKDPQDGGGAGDGDHLAPRDTGTTGDGRPQRIKREYRSGVAILASHHNNLGIAYAKLGRFDQAIRSYDNAMPFALATSEDCLLAVTYNKALSLVRASQFAEAEGVLAGATDKSGTSVAYGDLTTKIRSLRGRLRAWGRSGNFSATHAKEENRQALPANFMTDPKRCLKDVLSEKMLNDLIDSTNSAEFEIKTRGAVVRGESAIKLTEDR